MFTDLRWRLCLFFVLSTGLIYSLLALAGGVMIESGINSAVNEELKTMAVELTDIIDMSHLDPELNKWRHEKTKNMFMPTIQIYGKQQELLGQSGPLEHIPFIKTTSHEAIKDLTVSSNHLRILACRIDDEDSQASQLQLIVPLRQKDLAIHTYYQACLILSPFLLLGLSAAGYLFARSATQPIEKSFEILRNFVADAGHELNTPLTILQAHLESISDDFSDFETSLPVIMRTCQRMSNLVSDLLFLAQQESPAERIKHKEPIDLQILINNLYEEFVRLYEAKGLTLKHSSENGLTITADRDSIHRALANLLKNALNYTDNGTVTLRAVKSKISHHAEITVDDTGSGIPEESVAQIFDRFYRVQKHRSRASGGSGLGLAIVKAIIENHAGHISVRSKPGHGSSFLVELPLAH